MAVITPNSEIYLLKCPLELDNENQLSFANSTAQFNYFNSLPKLSLTNATFQRKDGTIRWPGSMENLLNYTYCMYRNKNHGNKWFYAFIENMEYVADTMTAIKIKTDVWQTYQFDLSWKSCFVEREHVVDDTLGKNLVPENLETGEYVQNKYEIIPYNLSGGSGTPIHYICLQLTELPTGGTPPVGATKIYNGVPGGCWIVGFNMTDGGIGNMNALLKWYDSNDKADAVVAMFVAPSTISLWDTATYTIDAGEITIIFPLQSSAPNLMKTHKFIPRTLLNGYEPKNNKVYQYPFNFLTISNNNGEVFEYRFEDFNEYGQDAGQRNPIFNVYGALCQGCQIKGIPVNYLKGWGTPDNVLSWDYAGWDYGINGAKYPLLSWISDYYLNWEAANGSHVATQATIGAFTSIANAALQPQNIVSGGAAALNIFGHIENALHQQHVAEIQPDQAKGNTSSGDLNFSAQQDMFSIRQMCVKAEFAKRIDDYFSAYGYRINDYKIPNRSGRLNWNYVKTQGCNITADIPQEDLQEIKGMFNNGITIWHNPATYLDYSQNNNIV